MVFHCCDKRTRDAGIITDNAEEYVKELKDMTGLGASLINKGIQQGIEQGIEQGIQNSIERLTKYFTDENPELTPEQAKEMAIEILRS